MKITTAHNHATRLISKLKAIYHGAILCKTSHAQLIQEVQQHVWQDPALKRCPSWVVERIMAHRDILSSQMYDHLRWTFIGSDGQPRDLDDLPEDDRQRVFSGAIQGHHYWLDSHTKKEKREDGTIVEIKESRITTKPY